MKNLEEGNKNEGNKLRLRQGSYVSVIFLSGDRTVAIPTVKSVANAKVLHIMADGSFNAHIRENYNLDGDFRSELMKFNNNLFLDEGDLNERNYIRISNGLSPIK